MEILNHALEKSILEADGRYLDTRELNPLEHFIRSYTTRVETYHQLREHSDQLVLRSLRKLAQIYPELVQQHGGRCKYDMEEVLRYMALAILRDDETLFKEKVIIWLDTILLAHRRNSHCVIAYRNLQEAIAATLSTSAVNLTQPYIDVIIQALQSHS